MKIVYSLADLRDMLVGSVAVLDRDIESIRFIHKCPDGSGELDIEAIAAIDRVEIELGE